MDNLKPPGELDFATTGTATIAEKWRQWKQTMQLFIELTMTKSSDKEKCSAFLYVIGQAGRDIYNTMTLMEEETNKIDVLFAKFKAYCKPKQNVTSEVQHLHSSQRRNNRSVCHRAKTNCKELQVWQFRKRVDQRPNSLWHIVRQRETATVACGRSFT